MPVYTSYRIARQEKPSALKRRRLFLLCGSRRGAVLKLRGAGRESRRRSTRDAFAALLAKWQQFLIRATDERGDPIQDYYIQSEGKRNQGLDEELQSFDVDVHTYSGDASLRSFHVNLDALDPDSLQSLSLSVIASSGSSFVTYHGFTGKTPATADAFQTEGTWHAKLDLSSLLGAKRREVFLPVHDDANRAAA